MASPAAASQGGKAEAARIAERNWQWERIPAEVRELVLDDQRRRNAICWNAFDD